MKRATKKQLDAAFDQGGRAALAGEPGAPTPYDDATRGWAWMAGYDSTDPKDCAPIKDEEWPA